MQLPQGKYHLEAQSLDFQVRMGDCVFLHFLFVTGVGQCLPEKKKNRALDDLRRTPYLTKCKISLIDESCSRTCFPNTCLHITFCLSCQRFTAICLETIGD